MKLSVQSRSGKELVAGGLDVPKNGTVDDVMAAFAEKKPKFYLSRQRFTLPPVEGAKRGMALVAGMPLTEYSLSEGSVLLFKDLGPQVGWTTVFFWEYLGPLVMYAAIYFFPAVFYPGHSSFPEKTMVQQTALRYWSFHYVKRILETFFVHRYSHGTMPMFNLFKNCTYYWAFGAYVAWFINHPQYTSPTSQTVSLALFGFALLCQASNFKCHQILASMRPAGSKEYVIPRGFLFNYITCANYATEIFGWIAFTLATRTVAAAIFTTCGALQMAQWAMQKHARLRKIFDGKDGREKYPRRWIMLPPFF